MRRRGRGAAKEDDPVVAGLARVAKLLALILAEGKTKTEAILRLASVGFPPGEIADLLGTTPNTVSVVVHQAKKLARTKKVGARE